MPSPSASPSAAPSPASPSQTAAPVLYVRSIYERLFHAVLFELLALLLCAPLISWFVQVPVSQSGTLTVMISLLAMLWNVVFNTGFDRLAGFFHWQRDWRVRLLHALTFETGLLLAVVPLAAWWLDVSLWAALLLDIGLVLFFLPYTLVYNWCYDKLRGRIISAAN